MGFYEAQGYEGLKLEDRNQTLLGVNKPSHGETANKQKKRG